MLNLKFITVYCLCLHGVFGTMIIDSGRRQSTNMNKLVDNSDKANNLGETKCSLSQELMEEIQSYQPIVDKIVTSVVDGQYSGSTWQR